MVRKDISVKIVVLNQVMAKNASCYANVNHNFVTLQRDVSVRQSLSKFSRFGTCTCMYIQTFNY